MKSTIFENLIRDAYKKREDGHIIGVIYGRLSNYAFSDLNDIDDFLEIITPEKVYLKSMITMDDITVSCKELEGYRVDKEKRTIYIKVKGRMEVALRY